ncbi:MAG: HEAT repeat domain-containing protein [Candidatus Eisenbacteria bacterium]|uniref:HEAT repeat domain-containing protein n=1 Tax=Eiseniibacteriota bacterium TaxID=2212470 RepID=A0A7Y2H247_UNCEI|nr:HEAT repeat domain-containing protein [Candidatus Eisenbacteria bacterium]
MPVPISASDAVFVGELISTDHRDVPENELLGSKVVWNTFRATEIWKGDEAKEFRVAVPPGECEINFELGESYLVFATPLGQNVSRQEFDVLITSQCMPTKELSLAAEEIAEIKRLKAEAPNGNLDHLLVERWFEDLKSGDDTRLEHAYHWPFSLRPDPNQSLTLIEAYFEDGEPTQLGYLLEAFVSMAADHPAAHAATRLALAHPSALVREKAQHAVLNLEIDDAERAAHWRESMEDPDPKVRSRAVRMYGHFGRLSASTEDIAALLQDPDDNVRASALNSLAHLRSVDEHLTEALPLLSHPEYSIRSRALESLSYTENPKNTLAVLTQGFEDSHQAIRASAVRRIAQLNLDPAHTEAILLKALEDPENNVRSTAISSINQRKIYSDLITLAVGEALFDSETHVRQGAAEALSRMGVLGEPILPNLEQQILVETDERAKFLMESALKEIQKKLREKNRRD